MSFELECPYCEKSVDPSDDQLEAETDIERECPHCEKTFIYQIEYHPYYRAHQVPCANGGEHDYQPMHGAPAEYFKGRKRCSHCSNEIQEVTA